MFQYFVGAATFATGVFFGYVLGYNRGENKNG